MTDTPTPDTAVQIAVDALREYPGGSLRGLCTAQVAALARDGYLHDPAEVAALRAHVDQLRDELRLAYEWQAADEKRWAALDALPTRDTAAEQ